MNPKEEFYYLIEDANEYSEDLYKIEDRLKIRIKKERKKRIGISTAFSVVAACFLFVLLVNTNNAFASAASTLPFFDKLVAFVRFDKSVSYAIENEYIEEVNLIARDRETTLQLPYLIADEKNLFLFFQMTEEYVVTKEQEKIWVNLKGIYNSLTKEKIENYSVYYENSMYESGDVIDSSEFNIQKIHFTEPLLEKYIEIEVELIKEVWEFSNNNTNEIENNNKEARNNLLTVIPVEMSNAPIKFTKESIGTYKFVLELKEFVAPKVYEMNKTYTVEGQEFTVTNMKVYPTGSEINFVFSKENRAWIKNIEIELHDSVGEVYSKKTGLNGSTLPGGEGMSIFIESNYFESSKPENLVIKAIRLLEKEKDTIEVDLVHKTYKPNVDSLVLKDVIITDTSTEIVFVSKIESRIFYNIFEFVYKDEKGKEYDMEAQGTIEPSVGGINKSDEFSTHVYLNETDHESIILKRAINPRNILEVPIYIPISK